MSASTKNFRFLSFSERLAQVHIDELQSHSRVSVELEPTTGETFFQECLIQLKNSVFSHEFKEFCIEVSQYIDSLPLIIFHKQKIVNILVQYIQTSPSETVKHLLSLCSHLARDLREELYPHFEQIFLAIVGIMDPSNVELLEDIFSCLSHLFKFLQKTLLLDMENIYKYYKELLAHKKEHIRKFAAESFAFLIRKLDQNQMERYLQFLLQDSYQQTEQWKDGISALFFELTKGVKYRLHSKAGSVITALLHAAAVEHIPITHQSQQKLELQSRYTVLKYCFNLIQNHVKVEQSTVLFDSLLAEVKKLGTKSFQNAQDVQMLVLCKYLILLVQWVSYKTGSFVRGTVNLPLIPIEPAVLWDTLHLLLQNPSLQSLQMTFLLHSVFTFFTSLVAVSGYEDQHRYVSPTVAKCMFLLQDPLPTFLLFKRLNAIKNVQQMYIEHFVRFTEIQTVFFPLTTLLFMRHMTMHQENGTFPLAPKFQTFLLDTIQQAVSSFSNLPLPKQSEVWVILTCLQRMDIRDDARDLVDKVDQLLQSIDTSIIWKDATPYVSLLYCEVTTLTLHFFASNATYLERSVRSHLDLLVQRPTDFFLLKSCCACLKAISRLPLGTKLLSVSQFEAILPNLAPNLSSSASNLRAVTLDVLQVFGQALSSQVQRLLQLCELIQVTPTNNLQSGTQIPIWINELAEIVQVNALPRPILLLISNFLLGTYCIKFSPVWPSTTQALHVVATKDADTFWKTVFPRLHEALHANSSDDTPSEPIKTPPVDIDTIDMDYTSWTDESSIALMIQDYMTALESWHDTPFTDNATYITLLFNTLESSVKCVEKYSSTFVPYFMEFYSTVYCQLEAQEDALVSAHLMSFLSILSKFQNINRIPQSDPLLKVFFKLLKTSKYQSLAFKCIDNYKLPEISPYRHTIELILTNDFIAGFGALESLKPEHQPKLLQLLFHVLFGKLLEKSKHKQQQRMAIFTFLAGFELNELDLFFPQVFEHFERISSIVTLNDLSYYQVNVPVRKQSGILSMLEAMLLRMPNKIGNYLKQFLLVPIYCLHRAITQQDATAEETGVKGKKIRSTALHVLTQVMEYYPACLTPSYAALLFPVIQPLTDKLDEHRQERSSLLEFILVFAKHHELASLLPTYGTVLHNMINLLAHRLSTQVMTDVLQFISRLLDIEKEHPTVAILSSPPYLSLVLQHIISLVKLRKKPFVRNALTILCQLCDSATQESEAVATVNATLPLIRRSTLEVGVEALTVVHRMLKRIQSAAQRSALVIPISKLFSVLVAREQRKLLCEIMQELAVVPQDIVALVVQLNSYSTTQVGAYDYDARLQAFNDVHKHILGCTKYQIAPLLYNCLYFVRDEDLPIRNTAILALEQLLQLLAQDTSATTTITFITREVYPELIKNLTSIQVHIFKNSVKLLGQLVRCFPTHCQDLAKLASTNDAHDFFDGLVQLRFQQKNKSLARLKKVCTGHNFQQSTLHKVLLPCMLHLILHEDSNVVNEAIFAVGFLVKQLNWKNYARFFQNLVQLLHLKRAKERVLLRTICEVADSVPAQGGEEQQQSPQEEVEEEEEEEQEEEKEEEEEEEKHTKQTDYYITKILPELTKQFKGHQGNSMRIPIALAIVKVIKRLPNDAQYEQLPRVITVVCQSLSSREEQERDSARQTLLSIAECLGPTYFLFILHELESSLTKGFQQHVMSYTLWYLLKGLIVLSKHPFKLGDLDYSLNDILHVLLEDTLGSVAEQHEMKTNTDAMKETKSIKSFESFELLGRIVTFPSSFTFIIDALKGLLQQSPPTSKMLKKLDTLLHRLLLGMKKNTSITPSNFLFFVHSQLTTDLSLPSDHRRPSSSTRDTQKPSKQDSRLMSSAVTTKQRLMEKNPPYPLFAEFALDIFYQKFKHNFFDPKDVEQLSMLSPFVPLLKQAMTSKFSKIVVRSIKCFRFLLFYPLPSVESELSFVIQHSISLLQSSDVHSEALNPCFKLFAAAMNNFKHFTLSDTALHYLVNLIGNDVEEIQKAATFSLLKAILTKKFVVPEIYDLMIRISYLMVRSDSVGVRRQASELFLQFLLYYPMGPERLQQHLDFIMNNLGYEYETGRESILTLLVSVFTKFPEEILSKHTEYFFLPLVVRLSNDDSPKCRRLIADAIKSLFQRTDHSKLDTCLTLIISWFHKPTLTRAAAQTLNLLLEVTGKQLHSKIIPLLPTMLQILTTPDTSDWDLIYFTLTALEKLSNNTTIIHSQLKDFWPVILSLLTHAHVWVRIACSQLIGLYFVGQDATQCITHANEDYLFQRQRMQEVGTHLCNLLANKDTSESVAEQITKSLLFIAVAFYCEAKRDSVSISEQMKQEDSCGASLYAMLKELSRLARVSHPAQQVLIFRWFAALVTQLEVEDADLFLRPIVTAVYRVQESTATTSSNDQLKSLVQEVSSFLQKRVGKVVFNSAYAEVHEAIESARRTRKRQRAFAAVNNPQAFIRKKQSKQQRIKLSRKRKMEEERKDIKLKVLKTPIRQ